MVFPATSLSSKAELLINGTWTDVTSYVRGASNMVIQRGQTAESGSTINVDTCQVTLENIDGRFSNRNPNSPYYGLLGRNTQFRVSAATNATRALYLYNRYDGAGGRALTTDKAVLDITGDLDIRFEIDPGTWAPSRAMVLASKWTNPGQQSWYVLLETTGELTFGWTTDGSTVQKRNLGGLLLAPTAGRMAVKITVDVDNGAAGKTIVHSYATSIGGTYSGGGTSTSAGTTSIFSSSAGLAVGNGTGGVTTGMAAVYTTATPSAFTGKYFGFQLRNGIGGTLVANADFAGQAAGTTSWSDGLGTPNTWSLPSTLSFISDQQLRFWGECSEFPSVWDTSGSDITVQLTASSLIRRIQHNTSPIDSSLKSYLLTKGSLVSYVPFEDENGSTSAVNLVSGVSPVLVPNSTFGPESDLASSKGAVTLTGTTSIINAVGNQASAAGSPTASFITFSFLFKLAADSAAGTPEPLQFTTTGGSPVKYWFFDIDDTDFYLAGADSSAVVLGSVFNATHSMDLSQWISIRIQIEVTGGNIATRVDWHQVGSSTNHSMIRAAYVAGTAVGRVTEWDFNAFGEADLTGMKLAQVSIMQEDLTADQANFILAVNSYVGETSGNRFLRTCTNSGITAFTLGDPNDTEAMGAQTPDTVVNLLEQCVDLDGGFAFSARDFNGLVMRTRSSLLAQSATSLSYSANHFDDVTAFRPTDDDRVLVNDVTVSRPGGSSGRSVITSGANNVSDPTVDPQGVGRYATSYQLNAQLDSRLPNLAQFATYLGTWDQLRLPQFKLSLQRAVFVASAVLTSSIISAEIGDVFAITGLPAWMPPDTLEVMARGMTEVIANRGWEFTFVGQNYGPFREVFPQVDLQNLFRAASTGSFLDSSINSTQTTMTIGTTNGTDWSSTAVPFDAMIDGERVTIGFVGISSGAPFYTQFCSSVTRSVNGVVKAHTGSFTKNVQIIETFHAAL